MSEEDECLKMGYCLKTAIGIAVKRCEERDNVNKWIEGTVA